jgi:hypothetical protein
MLSVFGSKYRCEQLLNLMKNVKSRTRTRLTDECVEGYVWIAATEIKSDIERFIKQMQCQSSH